MTTAAPLDLAFVRSQFPALADNQTGPFSTMPAGRRCCKSVADRVSDYLLTTSVQTGASYDVSQRASGPRHGIAGHDRPADRRQPPGGGRARPLHDAAHAQPLRGHGEPAQAGRRDRSLTDFDHEFEHRAVAAAEGARRRVPHLVARSRDLRDRPRRPRQAALGAHEARLRHALPRTSWARSTRSPRSPSGCTRQARGSAWTPWPMRRTARSTSWRRARTTTSSRSTRSTARISRSCGAATTHLLELDGALPLVLRQGQSPR